MEEILIMFESKYHSYRINWTWKYLLQNDGNCGSSSIYEKGPG